MNDSRSSGLDLRGHPSPLTADRLPGEYAYEIDELSFRYGARRRETVGNPFRWALRRLTCAVRAGEILGVIGPNGSGKSSFLNLLARVLQPAEGRITLFGESLRLMSQDAVARAVALVPQESHQVFPFSVAEIVLMGRFPHHESRWHLGGFGWETADDITLANQAMAQLDITHLAERPISDLSGGERQRAIIARALTQQPKVLLLDEPTAFLDLHHQLEICRTLRRLNEEHGLSVVLVSHDLNLASQYADRLLLLMNGELFRLGTPDEVIRPDVLQAVYGCPVLVDRHPDTQRPRVTLPGR